MTDQDDFLKRANEFAKAEFKPDQPTKPLTFTAGVVEVERGEHWIAHHGPCHEDTATRHIRWSFGQTGIGTAVFVYCLSCGNHLDVSDYGSW